VLEAPELCEDPRFQGNEGRLENRTAVLEQVATGLGRLEYEALITRLDAAGIPWGRLNGLAEVVAHPQLEARGRWQTVDIQGPEGLARMESLASPLSDLTADGGQPTVPALGAHTRELLHGLGIPPERIDELSAAGVVGRHHSVAGGTTTG
jgi:itaconate CoA-transferase